MDCIYGARQFMALVSLWHSSMAYKLTVIAHFYLVDFVPVFCSCAERSDAIIIRHSVLWRSLLERPVGFIFCGTGPEGGSSLALVRTQ